MLVRTWNAKKTGSNPFYYTKCVKHWSHFQGKQVEAHKMVVLCSSLCLPQTPQWNVQWSGSGLAARQPPLQPVFEGA